MYPCGFSLKHNLFPGTKQYVLWAGVGYKVELRSAWGWVNGELVIVGISLLLPLLSLSLLSSLSTSFFLSASAVHITLFAVFRLLDPPQPHTPPPLKSPLPSPPNPLLLLPLLHPHHGRNLRQRLLCCSRLHLQCYPLRPRPRLISHFINDIFLKKSYNVFSPGHPR